MKKQLRKIADFIKKERNAYPISERVRRFMFLKKTRSNAKTQTDFEEKLATSLKKEMNSLPLEKTTRKSNAENKWILFKNSIKDYALNTDPRTFIAWPPIRNNMHYVPSLSELSYLKSSPYWSDFEKALHTKSTVNIPFYAMPSVNENAIRQAFHLANFLKETGVGISEINQIFEFGGGYGSMCLLLSRLGFKGRYIIFDWPELSAIQRYYLLMEDVGKQISNEPTQGDIALINKFENIKDALDSNKKTLLIGTWSLSECSIELRNNIIGTVNPDYFLISYQKGFGSIDNEKYFKELRESRNDIEWREVPIAYIPSERNKYLFGRKKK